MCEALKNNYQLFEEIGRGQFGTINRCFSPISNEFFACKTIDKRLLSDSIDRECIENEPKMMSLLSPHPNIVQIQDIFENDDYLALVMELCQPISLYDLIAKGKLAESEAAPLVESLMQAIDHCHKVGVVHRDIKPDNILFDARNRLKLADFGSAEWLCGGRSLRGIVGTPYYVAPEILSGREYNEKVDVWSAGVILYVMLAGIPPFYGESAAEIFEAVLRGNLRFPPKIFRSVSAAAKDLLRKMLCKDVSRRLSAEQVLRHTWILSGGEMNTME